MSPNGQPASPSSDSAPSRPSLFDGMTAGEATPSAKRLAVIPAALTAFDDEQRLDLADFRRHIFALADVAGVSAIMVNGAAGHDEMLSRDERRRLLGEALAAVGGRVPIIAALRETPDFPTLAPFAKDAESEGAYAMTVMPPKAEADFEWDAARVRFDHACSASSLPVIIYQTRYATETLVRLAALPSVRAVKEGNGSPAVFALNLRALHSLDRPVAVWSTHSSWLLADLALGADGILSGMGSVAAELLVALADAVACSDLERARKVDDRIFPLARTLYRPGQDPHVRMKYALQKLGRQTHNAVRPPSSPLDEAERLAIDQALAASGICS